MTNDISTQLRPILQSVLSGNRNWLPNHVYAGVVQEILGNGSIAVLIDNKVYRAVTHIPVRSGELLNLRLLGSLPEPHFAITGPAVAAQQFAPAVAVKNSALPMMPAAAMQNSGLPMVPAAAMQNSALPAVAVQNSALPAVAMFGKLNAGIEGLATMLLQYPAELTRISPQLQPLLTAVAQNTLAASDIAKPGKLKSHVHNSGFFYDRHEAAGVDATDADLKGLLLQLLSVLQHKRTLTLLNGRPTFIEHQTASSATPARAASSLAAYSAQDDNTLTRDLKNIITQNAETTLLQIVSSQLAARDKSTDADRVFVMHLMIAHEESYFPLELELRQQVVREEEFWEAAFRIDLPVCGRMQWTLTVKNPSVNVQLASNNATTRQNAGSQTRILSRLMELQDLQLSHFSCVAMEGL